MTTTTQDQILELAAEQRCIDRAHIRASAHNLRAMAALVVPGATALLYEDWHEDGWVFCGVLSSDSTCYEQPRFPPEPTPLSPIGDLLASTSPALDENLQYRRHRFGTLRGAHVFLVNETADLSMLPGLDDEVTAIAQAMPEQRRPGAATDAGDTVTSAFAPANTGVAATQTPTPGPGEVLVTRDGTSRVLDRAAFMAEVQR